MHWSEHLPFQLQQLKHTLVVCNSQAPWATTPTSLTQTNERGDVPNAQPHDLVRALAMLNEVSQRHEVSTGPTNRWLVARQKHEMSMAQQTGGAPEACAPLP
jgi:hypothetical protein